jgi:peroxiredoxin
LILFDPTGQVLVIGVPGAFTPTCTEHLESSLEMTEDIKSKGVEVLNLNNIINGSFYTRLPRRYSALPGSTRT